MKKAILTFGLFSLVVLTSFTTTENQALDRVGKTGGDDGTKGGQGTTLGSNKKLDFTSNEINVVKDVKSEYSNNSNLVIGYTKKSDI